MIKSYQVYRVDSSPFDRIKNIFGPGNQNADITLITFDHTKSFNPITFTRQDRIVAVRLYGNATVDGTSPFAREEGPLWECFKLNVNKLDIDTVKYYTDDTQITFLVPERELKDNCTLDVYYTFKLQSEDKDVQTEP